MKDLCSSGKIYLEGETGKVKLHKLYLRTTVRHTEGSLCLAWELNLVKGSGIEHIKKQRHYFANKDPSSEGYGFSSGHVWM